MKFENTEVWGFNHALRGMRNPMNSWNKSDSRLDYDVLTEDFIGENDMKLAQQLIKAGSEHRKFMRQIFVSVDITAPLFWWKEFDTYKVGTVRNSCSTMHKIHVKSFEQSDFTHHGIDEIGGFVVETFNNVLDTLEQLRILFNETKEKKYWRAIIELLPDGYEMRATITLNYENLLGMCSKGQRRFHKQNEWSGIDCYVDENFIEWTRTLPYAQEFIFIDECTKGEE